MALTSLAVGDTVKQVRPLFSEEQIRARVAELSQAINVDFGTKEPLIVLIVLHGAILFAADLIRGLEMPTEIETLRLKSYHGTQSTGKVELVGKVPNLKGKQVLVVEDIIDTGKSLERLRLLWQELGEQGPRTVKVASLLDKPAAHPPHLAPDYVGFSIGNAFVIGYGLDLDGRYRNLPYVAQLVDA
jgi:hypoxanthine phosphoribosyltransferase